MKRNQKDKLKIKVDKTKERNYIAREVMDRQGPYRPKTIRDKRKEKRDKLNEQETKAEYEESEG